MTKDILLLLQARNKARRYEEEILAATSFGRQECAKKLHTIYELSHEESIIFSTQDEVFEAVDASEPSLKEPSEINKDAKGKYNICNISEDISSNEPHTQKKKSNNQCCIVL